MKIEELQILAAVFQEPNLSRVSRKFNMSQSNLSKLIKRAETESGIILFERKGFQGLRPTPQGIAFATRIQNIARAWTDALSLLRSHDTQIADLKITGPSLFMRNIFLPAWFENDFEKKYRLTYMQSRVDQLSLTATSGDLDLVITHSPSELSEWVPRAIYTERFALFTMNHKAKSLDDLDFKTLQWIGYRPSSETLQQILLNHKISNRQVTAYLDDVESILDLLVKRSDLVSILPAHALHSHPRLNCLKLPESTSQKLYLMYREGQETAKKAAAELRGILA